MGAVRQNGYVVRDIKAAMDHWINTLGIGPFYYIEKVPIDWFKHRGVEQHLELGIAIANCGELQIELIQQRNDAPSMYLEFLSEFGEGMQHMAWWSTNYQQDYDAALARGLRIGQEGQINGPQGRFVYFDTQKHPGTVIELSDISGSKGKLFEHIRNAARNWDGARPIRLIN
jgi:hypothetical protein